MVYSVLLCNSDRNVGTQHLSLYISRKCIQLINKYCNLRKHTAMHFLWLAVTEGLPNGMLLNLHVT